MSNAGKAQVYLLTFPVSDEQEARSLGSASAWEILEKLRDVGLDGLTAEQISKRLELSKSTVYNVLSKLQAAGWVESRRSPKKIGRPNAKRKADLARTGRMRRIYVENIPWGTVEFDDKFVDTLDKVLEEVLEKHEMVSSLGDTLDKILTNLTGRADGKKLLPSSELCSECKNSHEAEEFVWALCIRLIQALLSEKFSDKIKPVLEKHGVKALVRL